MNDQKHSRPAISSPPPYLQQLQALAFEISVAMDAIAANALAQLQESVAKQEMLCAVWWHHGEYRQRKKPVPRAAATGSSDRHRRRKIRATSGAICELNLQVCRAAQALRQVHCSSRFVVQKPHRTIPGGSRARLKQKTWSCEM
jgi:hypothetical protein